MEKRPVLLKTINFFIHKPLFTALLLTPLIYLLRFISGALFFGYSLEKTFPVLHDFSQNPARAVVFLSIEFLILYVVLRIANFYSTITQNALSTRISEGIQKITETQSVSVLGFTKLAEARDPDTGDHIIRIAYYSRILADELSKTEKYSRYIDRHYVEEMYLSAPLHDIGKVGIKDEILLKEDKLSEGEFEIMKMHTIIGGNIISELERKLNFRSFFTLGKEIAYHHHQRFDGSGYPNIFKDNIMLVEKGVGEPLSGERIPLSARIVALADVYDALISKRCYKLPFSHNDAKTLIIEQSGRHFDPDVVAAFLRREREFIEAKQKFPK